MSADKNAKNVAYIQTHSETQSVADIADALGVSQYYVIRVRTALGLRSAKLAAQHSHADSVQRRAMISEAMDGERSLHFLRQPWVDQA